MNETTNTEDRWLSITLAVLGLTVILFVSAQLRVVAIEKPMLEAQLNASAQRLTATKAAQVQADEALQKREEQVKALAETEAKYAALLTELIELAKVDPDARAITQKWKIQQQGQTGATGVDAGTQDAKPAKAQAVAPPKPKAP
jgi:hypothetical protein